MVKIIFVCHEEIVYDWSWIKEQFPTDQFDVSYMPLTSDFSSVQHKDCLFILCRYFNTGRLEPHILYGQREELAKKISREVDGILVFVPKCDYDGTFKQNQALSLNYEVKGEKRVTTVFMQTDGQIDKPIKSFESQSKNTLFQTLKAWWDKRLQRPEARLKAVKPNPLPASVPPAYHNVPVSTLAIGNNASTNEILTAVEIVETRALLQKACDDLLKKVIFHRDRVTKLRDTIREATSIQSLKDLIQSQLNLFNDDRGTRREKAFTQLSDPLRRKLKLSWGYYGMLKHCENILNSAPEKSRELGDAVNTLLRAR